MSEAKVIYQTLKKVDVNKHVEQRNGLSYLSWAHAWEELLKVYPESTYEIKTFTNHHNGVTLPYLYDDNLGYIVFTTVTVEGLSRDMWMVVMDGANNPLKTEGWTYKVKEYAQGRFTGNYIDKQVQPINMFDVNKAIMRCLTKNISMFGLGLSIYGGEDIPADETPAPAPEAKAKAPAPPAPKKLTAAMFTKAKEFTPEQIKKVLSTYTMTPEQKKELEAIAKKSAA